MVRGSTVNYLPGGVSRLRGIQACKMYLRFSLCFSLLFAVLASLICEPLWHLVRIFIPAHASLLDIVLLSAFVTFWCFLILLFSLCALFYALMISSGFAHVFAEWKVSTVFWNS